MKKMIIFILLGSMAGGLCAQDIEIRGKVCNALTKEILDFANIVLHTPDSIFVTGVTTDDEGKFCLDKIQKGDYILAVSNIGYKTQYTNLEGLNKSIHLNDILMEEDAVALETVTVNASNLNTMSDRKVVFPSERQVTASTNGVNLLQQLMLPRLQVNPMSNEVSVPGGGEVQLRINGAKVEIQEVVALQPAEIIRIEYHDNPGLRYGNAEIVLDYIVRRPETGGSFGVDVNDAVTTAWGNNTVHGKINHKKSEISANYGYYYRDFYEMWRDNEEIFTFSDGSKLHRREEGQPGHAQLAWQNLNTSYSFQEKDKMFSATLRYYTNDQPHWDYRGSLYNVSNPSDAVHMIDKSAFKTHRPALDLYYQQNLKKDQTIVFNLVGTYNYTNSKRFYQESKGDELLTDVDNLVKGNKYSIIGEGIYEKRLGNNRLSGGKSNYVNESKQMVALQLTYNFSFGRKFSGGQKRVNNSDNDSGVMSTGK